MNIADPNKSYLSHALAAELGNYVHELCCAMVNFENTQKVQLYRKSLHLLATFVRPILAQEIDYILILKLFLTWILVFNCYKIFKNFQKFLEIFKK